MQCDFCAYNEYDEEDDAYYCSVNMDEDDMARFLQSNYKQCPFYKSGDEYKVVRHQMQQEEKKSENITQNSINTDKNKKHNKKTKN